MPCIKTQVESVAHEHLFVRDMVELEAHNRLDADQ